MAEVKTSRTHLAAAVCASILFVTGLVFYDHSPPFRFVSGDIIPAKAVPGQLVDVAITLDWKRLCELNVTRVMRDGAGDEHKLPWSPSSPPPRTGVLTSKRQIVIPTTAKYGPDACYRASIYMTCGILDRAFPIKIDIPCIPFEIVPP